MQYHISRDGKTYGPYSLPDLQRMVSQGQVLAEDLAWAEGMPGWAPVKQVLGGAPAAPAAAPAPQPAPQPQPQAWQPPQQQPAPQAQPQQQAYRPPQPQAQPYGAQPQQQQPYGAQPQQQPYGAQQASFSAQPGGLMPPSMHWGLVLLLALVTCGIFGLVWMFIQAGFVKKLDPRSKATQMFLIYIGAAIGSNLLSMFVFSGSITGAMIGTLIVWASLAFFWIGAFDMRKSLVNHYNSIEPMGLRLSGIMTFFFSILYFQYHFTRIAVWKRTGRLVQ